MKLKIVLCLIFFLLVSGTTLAKQFNVLLFTKTNGWHHKSINAGVTAMEGLAEMHHFDLQWHEDAAHFNDDYLKTIDVVVFLSTSGEILTPAQRNALKRFVQSGKGFVGIHSASDTELNWPWYGKLVGHRFKIHPEIQTAKITRLDDRFPGMAFFHQEQLWTDEWYEFEPEQNINLHYLLSVDETTYSTYADWGRVSGNGMGAFHPISWYQTFQGGRSFYTALGHMPATYLNPQFLNHIYGGLYWAATGKGILQTKKEQ